MATQNYAASVQGASIRVTRLKSDGTLLNGALDSYTTSAFLRMSFTPEYEDGEEITEKAADGTVCVSYKAPDRLKRVTMELAICEPDPELTALLAGGVLLSRNENTLAGTAGATPTAVAGTGSGVATAGAQITLTVTSNTIVAGDYFTLGGAIAAGTSGSLLGIQKADTGTNATTLKFTPVDTNVVGTISGAFTATKRTDQSVGWAAPAIGDDPAGNGVAIEVWSHAVANGKRASKNPYFRWVFPYVRLRASGDRVIENGLLANTFEGYGIGNSSFGTGIDTTWEYPEVTDRPYAYARTPWSPSLQQLKGFYTWAGPTPSTTQYSAITPAATAVAQLPIADLDVSNPLTTATYNTPGAADYNYNSVTDVIASDN